MKIRPATKQDSDLIRAIHLAAFDASENEPVAQLAIDLLAQDSSPPCLSLVAEYEGCVVGHVAFSPVGLAGDADFRGYILGPLAVDPDHHSSGFGTGLVREGIRLLEADGVELLIVYGDPAYYGRFGFSVQAAEGLTPPYPLQFDFGWQAMPLGPGDKPVASGRISCVGPLNDPVLW